MILPDSSVILHAYHSAYRRHAQAKEWWEEKLHGPAGVAMAWSVILAFIRITTNPRILRAPFTPLEALAIVKGWLELPHFIIAQPAARHFEILSSLLGHAGTAGNLTTDGHLAALAIERGLVLQTTDADFSRFPGLKWINPLA